jgi:reverse gyrase
MKELLELLAQAVKGIDFPDRTKYIVACGASVAQIKMWEEKEVPAFLKGNKPNQYIYLMPEIAHKFSQREQAQGCADELAEVLGEGYTVQVCATKSSLIMGDDNFISLENE